MLLIGFGLMAGIDEIVFHQILAWHHFFDRSTSAFSLVAYGFLHAAELIAIVFGFFMYAEARRHGPIDRRTLWGAFLTGVGAFQLFDGVIDHKVLRVHQIRYGVDNLLAYDLVWNAAGVVALLVGLLLLRRRRAQSAHA